MESQQAGSKTRLRRRTQKVRNAPMPSAKEMEIWRWMSRGRSLPQMSLLPSLQVLWSLLLRLIIARFCQVAMKTVEGCELCITRGSSLVLAMS